MTEPTIILSNRSTDFQKVRLEAVSFVAAVSNLSNGISDAQAGVYLLIPAENVPNNPKLFSRLFFISPGELIRDTVNEAGLQERMLEMVRATPIAYHAKRYEYTYLDTNSAHYLPMRDRLLSLVQVIRNNFKRDANELIALYDGFTQPSLKLPACNVFQAQAAFNHRDLLNSYRLTQGLPQPPAPTITDEIRKKLEQFGVATHGFALRDEKTPVAVKSGTVRAPLPAAPANLQQAAQGMHYGKEVQMILHTLGNAIAQNEIQPLVMNDAFRAALAKAVDAARAATYTALAEENLFSKPHA